ncbi:MAG: hypothetical protein NTW11_02145 [Candidatus Staskawiczbacteria bacterium]|nr:hypothetical protein [Candidatus Staskawiczbacteria bacterium]
MKMTIIEYKCRRCEAHFDGKKTGIEPGIAAVLDELAKPIPLTWHSCANGGHGAADIIGYREEQGLM